MLEVLLALGVILVIVLGLPAVVVVFSYTADVLWGLLRFLGKGVFRVWDLTAGKTNDGLDRLFNGKPEPEKPGVQPDYKRIESLEKWEKFYRMGCYEEGDCQHVREAKEWKEEKWNDREKRAREAAEKELRRARAGDSDVVSRTQILEYGETVVHAELLHYFQNNFEDLASRPVRPDQVYCQQLEASTRGNRFDHLKPWLDDVERMIDASPEDE